jgi:hypothetical protein
LLHWIPAADDLGEAGRDGHARIVAAGEGDRR